MLNAMHIQTISNSNKLQPVSFLFSFALYPYCEINIMLGLAVFSTEFPFLHSSNGRYSHKVNSTVTPDETFCNAVHQGFKHHFASFNTVCDYFWDYDVLWMENMYIGGMKT